MRELSRSGFESRHGRRRPQRRRPDDLLEGGADKRPQRGLPAMPHARQYGAVAREHTRRAQAGVHGLSRGPWWASETAPAADAAAAVHDMPSADSNRADEDVAPSAARREDAVHELPQPARHPGAAPHRREFDQ